MDPETRAREGVFMAFQYPVEIPGVNNAYFLKAALNALRKHRGEEELDAMDFMALVRDRMKRLEMDESLMNRPVNEGFSGGEKKRNEIFQMAVLEPTLAVLDETDSGLDIDALKIVAHGVNTMRGPERGDAPRHALSAAAQLHRARCRPRAHGRPDRPVGREGAGARARGKGVRLDGGGAETAAASGAERMTSSSGDAFVAEAERLAADRRQPGSRRGWRARVARRWTASSDLGFPTTRDEEWRFTSVAPIAESRFSLAAQRRGSPRPTVNVSPLRLPGRPPRPWSSSTAATCQARSDTARLPAGVRVESLAAAVASPTDGGRSVPRSARVGRRRNPFSVLNTAFLGDGAAIVVPDAMVRSKRRFTCCSCRARRPSRRWRTRALSSSWARTARRQSSRATRSLAGMDRAASRTR